MFSGNLNFVFRSSKLEKAGGLVVFGEGLEHGENQKDSHISFHG